MLCTTTIFAGHRFTVCLIKPNMHSCISDTISSPAYIAIPAILVFLEFCIRTAPKSFYELPLIVSHTEYPESVASV